MRDIIAEIWATSSRNKLRTALTGFAVAWGIFMLIFLLGAGNGFINGITSNVGSFLANSMQIFGGQTSKAYKGMKEGRSIDLNDADISSTQNHFSKNIETLGAQISQDGVTITYGENYVSSTLYGVYPNVGEINKIEMLHGRFINDIDNSEQRKSIVISENQAKELAPNQPFSLIGNYVKVDNFAYRVVGINKSDGSSMSTDTYTAFTTLRTMYGRGDKADNIIFSFKGLDTEEANEDFEKEYKSVLNRNHNADPGDEEAIWVWNRFTMNMQMNAGMSIVRTALWIVGIFTLLSGIVGVSNIMLISVKERTREFGIRKAIGAKPRNILYLIIVESIIITTFFGYIGMLLGIAANQYMDATIGQEAITMGSGKAIHTFLNPTVGIDVCIEATLVMVIAGTIAGLIPARKAAKIRPIEALRAE